MDLRHLDQLRACVVQEAVQQSARIFLNGVANRFDCKGMQGIRCPILRNVQRKALQLDKSRQ